MKSRSWIASASIPWLQTLCILLGTACAGSTPTSSVPAWCREAPTKSVTITPSWSDHSPHQEGFIQVRGALLHYLEWAASTAHTERSDLPVLVLLAGAGQSAHIFDEFAPCFGDRFRVIALTRRGTAPSSAPDGGYEVVSLANDVVALLDSLGIARADFAGHSLAGAEITSIASRYPERVGSLVYLDASADLAGSSDVGRRNPVPRPPPPPPEASLDQRREWLQHYVYGGWSNAQEADLRAVTAAKSGKRLTSPRGLADALRDAAENPQTFDSVRAPAIVFLANQSVRSLYPWLDPTRDAEALQRAANFVESIQRPWAMRGPARQRHAMPTAVFVELAGRHDIFIVRRDTVVKAMRALLSANQSASVRPK